MNLAETVEHLHHAMTWDFRLLAILNGLLCFLLVLAITSRK